MNKLRFALATAVIAAFVTVNTVKADATNIRPVAGANLGSLDNVLNNVIHDSGPNIDVNNQSTAALFTNDASGGAIATFIIEIAGNAATNTFGIYKAGASGTKAEIFTGPQTAGSQATVAFFLDGTVKVTLTDGVGGTPVVVSNVAGFGSQFGFYLGVNSTTTYFSEDSLNPNGDAQALVYRGNNATGLQIDPFAAGLFTDDEFIVAFEDIQFNSSDKDFNDLVVIVESITPIPAPGALLLGVMGMGLVGWFRKRVK